MAPKSASTASKAPASTAVKAPAKTERVKATKKPASKSKAASSTEIEKLKELVKALKDRISDLESENAALQACIDSTEGQEGGKSQSDVESLRQSPQTTIRTKEEVKPPVAVPDAHDDTSIADQAAVRKRKRSISADSDKAGSEGETSLSLGRLELSSFDSHGEAKVLADITKIQWIKDSAENLPDRLVIVMDPNFKGKLQFEIQITPDEFEKLELEDVPGVWKKAGAGYRLHKLAYMGVLLSKHLEFHHVVFCEGTAFLQVLKNQDSNPDLWKLLVGSGVVLIGSITYLKKASTKRSRGHRSDKVGTHLPMDKLQLYGVYHASQMVQ